MELKELKTIVNDRTKFHDWFLQLLKDAQSEEDFDKNIGEPRVVLGYDDGYYWDKTSVELNDDGTLRVIFDTGSGSGWIPYELIEYQVTFEQFRQYLLNRKWADDSIDTIEILTDEVNRIEAAKVVRKENDDDFWEGEWRN